MRSSSYSEVLASQRSVSHLRDANPFVVSNPREGGWQESNLTSNRLSSLQATQWSGVAWGGASTSRTNATPLRCVADYERQLRPNHTADIISLNSDKDMLE